MILMNILNNAKQLFKNIGLQSLRKKAGRGVETLYAILKQSLDTPYLQGNVLVGFI